MLIYLFSAWACAAVGRTAQEVVNEVRRQFSERPGIMVSSIIALSVAEVALTFGTPVITSSSITREIL